VLYAPGYDQEKVTKALAHEALDVAKKAKTVLFFTGTTSSMESEGFDRTSLDLPIAHRKLLAAVAKVNPNIVVILNNGAAVDLRDTPTQRTCHRGSMAFGIGSRTTDRRCPFWGSQSLR
jgi:hypothetical protein